MFRAVPPRRIPAADLKEVYREGAALRLEFSTAANPREVVPLWADDRDTAANIVQLLPTTRTVELEGGPARAAPRIKFDRRVVVALFAGIAVGSLATYLLMPGAAAPELPAAPALPATAPLDATIDNAIPDVSAPANRSSPAWQLAAPVIAEFNSHAEALLADYKLRREDLEADRITQLRFADELSRMQLEWWDVSEKLLDADALSHPDIAAVRARVFGTVRHWRDFLILYSEGMRRDDHFIIRRAFNVLRSAEHHQRKMREYAP